MTSRLARVLVAVVAVAVAATGYLVVPRLLAQRTTPLVVVETSQGTFAFDTYAKDASYAVEHIVGLVKDGFYDGQRVHRAVPGFLVQFGDPQTRDLEKKALWGRGPNASSGHPVPFVEMPLKHHNVKFAVGLAHMGEPAKADSQLYILLDNKPELDGQYAVVGQVVEGQDVLTKLQVGDQINRVYIRE